jgi:hypothetical protein
MIKRAAIHLLVAAICVAGEAVALPEQGPWSARDLNAAVDAALISIDSEKDPGTRALMLTDLAKALEKTGVTAREQEIFRRAAGYLRMPTTDYSVSDTREAIVAGLARSGDLHDAEALAGADTAAANKPALLGKLAEGRLGAGDLPYVVATVARIEALTPPSAAPGPVQKTPAAVLAEIGVALAVDGEVVPAAKIAARLPDLERLKVNGEIAHALCAVGAKARDLNKGREIAQQSVQLARLALNPAKSAPNQPELAKRELAGAAAFAVAECQGPAEAAAFVNEVASQKSGEFILDRLFSEFVRRKELGLAAAIDRPADPADVDSMLAAVGRRQQRGDGEGALALATQASQLVLSHDAGNPPLTARLNPAQVQFSERIRSVFFKLKSLGAYDAAMATVQPIDPGNRRVYFLSLIQAETMKRDSAAVARTLPAVTDFFKQPLPGANYPFELVKALALGGYRDQARELIRGFPPFSSGETALIEAALGDTDAALAALSASGPLVAKPNAVQLGLTTIMAFDGAQQAPSKEEVAKMAARVQAAAPPSIPGSRANLMSGIVNDLAAAGDIEGAKKIAAQFDAEPNPVLEGTRNIAFVAIANAQIKAGKPRDALATALKISQPSLQWEPLLKLAALPPNTPP